MAAAVAASPHRRIAALQLHGQQLRIQQGHQPAHRPGEAALPLPPTHEPAPLKCSNPAGNQLGQHAGGGAPRLLHRGEHKGPLGCLAHLQGLRSDAAAAGKANGGLGGKAILEGLAGGGAFALLHQVRLGQCHSRHADGQPARGAGNRDRPVLQPGGQQIAAHQSFQLGQGQPGEVGGQLLGSDLEQERAHTARAG